MDRPKLTATELRRRYRQGERNFANINLRGESLRGLNLHSIDLCGTDLSHTDLRGANFSDAKLVGAKLCEAKTGTQRRWAVPKITIALVFVPTTLFLVSIAWVIVLHGIVEATKSTSDAIGNVITSMVILLTIFGVLFLTHRQGVLATFGIVIALTSVFLIATIPAVTIGTIFDVVTTPPAGSASDFGVIGSQFHPRNWGLTSVFLGGFFIAIISNFIILILCICVVANTVINAYDAALIVSVFSVITVSMIWILAEPEMVGFSGDSRLFTLPVAMVCMIISQQKFNCLISSRALKGDPHDQAIRGIVVWFTGLGGTCFERSDLTDADFSRTTLKRANLNDAKLLRTRFHLTQKVYLARLGKTILADFGVQDLLITLRGRGKVYVGKNLKGANLVGARVIAS